MQLSDAFNYLAYSELSNVTFTDSNGNIKLEHYPKLITLINAGVRELHTVFELLEKQIYVDMYAHITNYYLKPAFALTSGSTEVYKYIADSPYYPFKGNVLKVLKVLSETGVELPLNNEDSPISVFTPSPSLLQVSYPTEGASLNVVYQSYPDNIDTAIQDLNTELDIPDYLMEALVYFVCNKLFSSIGADKAEAVSYFSKYQNALRVIRDTGVFSKDTHYNTNLERNQWV